MSCLICSSTNLKTKFRFVDNSIFSENGQIQMLECNSCGFIFNSKNLRITDEELTQYYQGTQTYEAYKLNVLQGFGGYINPAKNYFDFIKSQLSPSDLKSLSAIDVGGGAGEFCYYLKNWGLDCDLLDYSKHRTKIAHDVFGIERCYRSLEEVDKKYDMIFLCQVIEHVADPVTYLSDLMKKIGKEQVRVFIATPNSESLGARIYRRRWAHYNPHHISLFSEKSIQTLFEKVGLKVQAYDGSRMYGTQTKSTLKSFAINLTKYRKAKSKILATDGLCAFGAGAL